MLVPDIIRGSRLELTDEELAKRTIERIAKSKLFSVEEKADMVLKALPWKEHVTVLEVKEDRHTGLLLEYRVTIKREKTIPKSLVNFLRQYHANIER